MPFTIEQFFGVFTAYNAAIWPAQLAAYGLGLAVVASLWLERAHPPRFIPAILALMWLWNAAGYHWLFFAAINPAAKIFAGFFVLQTILLAGCVVAPRGLSFGIARNFRTIAGLACIFYAMLMYPALGFLAGHGFMAGPMFGVAQADAHVCLLDALGIRQAAVLGGSAGAPSALQMAIRHTTRVSALILLVPLAYKPPTQADSAPAMPSWVEKAMMPVIGSDFLFWSALHLARDPMIETVLATPPALLAGATPAERARVNAMLDGILPVSARAEGLRSDTAIGKNLAPAPLGSIQAPTLIISARDDRYGTYASAEYTASQIAGARFIGFERGGHTWVSHDDAVMAVIMTLLTPAAA